MVRNVVTPAMTSVPSVLPRSLTLNMRSIAAPMAFLSESKTGPEGPFHLNDFRKRRYTFFSMMVLMTLAARSHASQQASMLSKRFDHT